MWFEVIDFRFFFLDPRHKAKGDKEKVDPRHKAKGDKEKVDRRHKANGDGEGEMPNAD